MRFFLLVLSLPVFAGSPVQGIHNFYKVDEHVYRGGQPTEEGFRYLAKIGVKTVIDLRGPFVVGAGAVGIAIGRLEERPQ